MGLERRVNVLIYLNKNWREEYGGCLELWDQNMKKCRKRIIPTFNTCVIFNTDSTSFHGNPVPVSHPGDESRRSIALYYYTATWDNTRRAHTTLFKARRNSLDKMDFRIKLQELVEDLVPPVAYRALRKIVRAATQFERSTA
jgi:hypothetical protein